MKKGLFFVVLLAVGGLFVWTALFLYQKSIEAPVVYNTDKPFMTSIVKKTVATGKITPRKEVEIKSQASGVVASILVEAGQLVKKGDLLARIEIIPDMERLNSAESQLQTARINFKNAERELNRQTKLIADKLVSENVYYKFVLDYDLQREAVTAAENNVALIKEGASKNADKVSNLIWATVPGTVLDVPIREGSFVTETNNFNAGTTIAMIADMGDMIFEGQVDESEVGKIRVGMELVLNIGAIEGEPYTAVLEYIAPKGVEDQGTIKFELRAALQLKDYLYLRAGYSANADIVLDRRENILAINEGNLQFDEQVTYVEIEVSPQVFERRDVKTGLSDGINIEVLAGLKEIDTIKKL
ncbi:MAG: efflux RND transporter periplasmic adaptor subunit [Pseudomonadales bacterium]